MPTRKELHELIDSLPEGAIETAHRVLTNMQVWPPVPPPGVEEMRQQIRKRMEERQPELMQRQKPGTFAGFGGSSNYDPKKGGSASGFSYWDGDTYTQETYRRHQGNELTVIERIRIDGRHLIYMHEIEGPGGKREKTEVTFDLS